MATVSKWTPFGVALDITATGGTVTRTKRDEYTVVINASWETYYEGARTNYGMTASSGGSSATINTFGTKASSGSGSFTGTYSISGYGAASKTITVTFRNFNNDNGDSATKTVSFNVSVPAWPSYTLIYNANGGTGAPASQTKWQDVTLVISSTKPTRTGYTFLGWGTSASATTASWTPGSNYTSWVGGTSRTIYAVWKANTYTVTYNANGGTGAPANQTKTYGTTLTLSSTKPTRTNYNFKGWGTSASATTVSYSAGGSYTANKAITLYAIWELAYTKPRITNLSLKRVNSVNVESDDGTYCGVSFNWACDKENPTIKIECKLSTATAYAFSTSNTYSGTSGTINIPVGTSTFQFDTELSYDIRVTVTDSGGSSYVIGTLPSMRFVFDAKSGGKGAAVGKAAEEDGLFDIGFKTRLLGGLEYVVIEAGTDLNTLLTPNLYAGNNANAANYTNCPITSGTFTLEVFSAGPTGQVYQRLTLCDKSKGTVYERFYYTSAWSEWTGGWIYPTLGSEFVMYGEDTTNQVKYCKRGSLVEVRGIVKPVVDIAYSTDMHDIFTLQSGYRPNSSIYVICQGSGNCTWLLRVNTNGVVSLSRYRNGNTNTTASVGAWLPFQVTFFTN